jgi:PIN domain
VSVTLDTMVLIWGGLRPPVARNPAASAHAVDMEFRSRVLIRDLEDRGEKIIIPTVAVAELLTALDDHLHGKFIAALTDRFFCPPFDLRAAAMAAQLWQWHRRLPPEQQIQRSILKADVLIIAVAKVAGASVFYSHDAKSRKLAAQAGMKALDLPTHSENMFTNAEMKKLAGTAPPTPQSTPKQAKKRRS